MRDQMWMLSTDDPLYPFLVDQILTGSLNLPTRRPTFSVRPLDSASVVYWYSCPDPSVDLVGKFYGNKWLYGSQSGHDDLRANFMHREFENLEFVRRLSDEGDQHRVVRPLGTSKRHNCVLLEEYVPGTDLDAAICEAVHRAKFRKLLAKLEGVAGFLADLHRRTSGTRPPPEGHPTEYLNKVIGQLADWEIISAETRNAFLRCGDAWTARLALDQRSYVKIHGDATPTNFIFDPECGLTAIDLERFWVGDPAADVGRVIAELTHLFLLYTCGVQEAGEFADHFYRVYVDRTRGHLPDMDSLADRTRYHVGCDLLRISRNSWLDLTYRSRLVEKARACLASPG